MGDSPIKRIVSGLHEKSRMGTMDGLRSFLGVGNRSAVDVGGMRRGPPVSVKKPQFEDFPDAVIREGADECAGRGDLSSFLMVFAVLGTYMECFFLHVARHPADSDGRPTAAQVLVRV